MSASVFRYSTVQQVPMVTIRLSLNETPAQNLLTARAKSLLQTSKQYKVEVTWCYCNTNSDMQMKIVPEIQKDKICNNLICQWQTEKWQKNGQILHNGQMRFFMASAL